MPLIQAQRILNHLNQTNQAFCFLMTGELITREDCEKAINEQTQLTWN